MVEKMGLCPRMITGNKLEFKLEYNKLWDWQSLHPFFATIENKCAVCKQKIHSRRCSVAEWSRAQSLEPKLYRVMGSNPSMVNFGFFFCKN